MNTNEYSSLHQVKTQIATRAFTLWNEKEDCNDYSSTRLSMQYIFIRQYEKTYMEQ